MKRSTLYSGISLISACAFLLSGTLATYAAWSVQNDTVNELSVGNVKGQIVEEYKQDTVVYPDADVTKIVQVKNTGSIDEIPRVMIEKVWGSGRDKDGNLEIDPDLSTDNIEITYNTENWYSNPDDGYFYYKGVLAPGETTESLFDSFRINGDISGREYADKFADIIVKLEVMQAAGDSLSYWDMSYEDLGITYNQSDREDIVTSVRFHGPKKGFTFEVNGGDLFADFKDLIPGESRSQIVEVTNLWDGDVDINFWADYAAQEESDEHTNQLVEKLLREYANIVITDESGDLLYEGPVWGSLDTDTDDTSSMKYPKSLGHYKKGETRNVNLDLYLSPELNNEHLDLLGRVKWVFSAVGETSTDPAPPYEESVTTTQTSTDDSGHAEVTTTQTTVQDDIVVTTAVTEQTPPDAEVTTATTQQDPPDAEVTTATTEQDPPDAEVTTATTEQVPPDTEVTTTVQTDDRGDPVTTSADIHTNSATVTTTAVSDDDSGTDSETAASSVPAGETQVTTRDNALTETETTTSQAGQTTSDTGTVTTVSTTTVTGDKITNTVYEPPKTGDRFRLILYLGIMAVSVTVMIVTYRKSKSSRKT